MTESRRSLPSLPRLAFAIAWVFFVLAAGFGFLLRLQVVHPVVPLEYAHLLHTHSHAAFLGWVFNAFFGLALHFFVRPENHRNYWVVFLIMQLAAVGMLFTFPFQGYAAASISFSTLHLASGAVFAWKLLRGNVAVAGARTALGWAFVFLLLSAAGPLALGPLAAAGLKGNPWYHFSIYFYLHFQYNGWFVFFLLAVFIQHLSASSGAGIAAARVIPAVHWLAAGCVLTVILSAWWMGPTGWMYFVAGAGGIAQLIGFILLVRARPQTPLFHVRVASALALLALILFALKLGLQLGAAWPALADLAMARPSVIGFLHLVFLGVITPLLIACAAELGWLRIRGFATGGLGLLLAGTFVAEFVLFAQPLPLANTLLGPWLHRPEVLALSALTMWLGVLMLTAGFLGTSHRPPPPPTTDKNFPGHDALPHGRAGANT
jgi:hypothetical protein